ncbi:MAG: hypothetical protein HY820_20920 [Acidobacteria bacterium]|nr:hypothetical protein [Acidobacteriota bacterium]
MDLVPVLSRWAHIASMAFLTGGALFAHLAYLPALDKLPEAEQTKLGDRVADSLRSWIFIAVALLILSGLYNFLNKPMYPPGYHAWFGVKMLAALHIVAVSILLGKTGVPHAKRKRWVAGISLSAILVIGLSAVLRAI